MTSKQRQRTGQVFTAQLVPPLQLELGAEGGRDAQHVIEALSPGNRTTRYGREWIVGHTQVEDGRFLNGRLGFRGAEGNADVFDEAVRDFVVVPRPMGEAAPFVVDLSNLQLAIQVIEPNLNLTALLGAIRNLLSTEAAIWSVEIDARSMGLRAWRSTVERVIEARIKVQVPNPHWQDAPDLRRVMEDAAAQQATLDLKSEDGIDLDASFLEQSQRHVDAGYGEATYRGRRKNGRVSVYRTKLAQARAAITAVVNPETGEVAFEDLEAALASDRSIEETVQDDHSGQPTTPDPDEA